MSTATSLRSPWLRHLILMLLTAAICHVGTVWLLPRVIMWRVMSGPMVQDLGGFNHAGFAPPVDASSRRIVMPSPDLLYSVCLLDLDKGPVRVSADPQWPDYWSVALYAENSDNFFVLNDQQTAAKPVNLWVSYKTTAQAPTGSTLVVSPSSKALLLMRVLTSDYAAQAQAVEKARHSLRCSPEASRPNTP